MNTDWNIPVLVITDSTDETPIHIGLPTLLVDGEPVKWPTVDSYHVEFSDEGLTTLTVKIPVRLRVVPPETA